MACSEVAAALTLYFEYFLANVKTVLCLLPGTQREIFPGVTKVDAGPPKFFGPQSCAKFFYSVFPPKILNSVRLFAET